MCAEGLTKVVCCLSFGHFILKLYILSTSLLTQGIHKFHFKVLLSCEK